MTREWTAFLKSLVGMTQEDYLSKVRYKAMARIASFSYS